jgi:Tol biopolymer transport system component
MGMVYKAQDVQLDRFVAIKVLSPDKAQDPEYGRRIAQEAKAASSLNHPNIITVYEIGEIDGGRYIAMEFIAGKTLASMIGWGGLPLEEAVGYATQVADALAAAHAAGIVHRDLKPANIMVTEKGLVKVLDFGLAKVTAPTQLNEGDSTLSLLSRGASGRVMGTAAYMAPEQAEGKLVDSRSDVFSFGATLYEMFAGQQAFRGGSILAALTSVLKDEPRPLRELRPEISEALAQIVSQCLRKDPERRYQHVGDVKLALQQAPLVDPVREAMRPSPLRFAVAAALLAAVLAVGWYVGRSGRAPAAQPVFSQLTDDPQRELHPAISPDGKSVAYSSPAEGNWDIFLLRVGGRTTINLTKDSRVDDRQPTFSPDGQHIAFRSERDGGGIYVMGATGENIRRVSDFGYYPAWSPDGKELVIASVDFVYVEWRFSGASQLWRVDIASGQKKLITGTVADAMQPNWSPDGRRIAFWSLAGGRRDVYTIPAEGGDATPVTSDRAVDWGPVWSGDGRYLYYCSDRGGSMNIWRVRIDPRTGKPRGEPEAFTAPARFAGPMSISTDGRRIAYTQQYQTMSIERVAFDPDREVISSLPQPVTQGSRMDWFPEYSSDGQWIAFSSLNPREDIYLVRPDGSGLRRLTDDDFRDRQPRWSPDGKRIAFYSNRSGKYQIWSIRPDGSNLEQVTSWPDPLRCLFWSPDGEQIGFNVRGRSPRIFSLSKPSGFAPLPDYQEAGAHFEGWSWSPDGDRIAGYLERPDGNPTTRGLVEYTISTRQYRKLASSGRSPLYLRDGKRLLFHDDRRLHLLDTRTGKLRPVISVLPHYVNFFFGKSPDDRSIVYGVAAFESDIWLMDLTQ